MIKVIKQILPKDQPYNLAVSMGTDSVATLFWLKGKGYDITPLHFNHALRPQNHEMHHKFEELCRALNLEGKSEIGSGLKTEAECREARLDFFSRMSDGRSIITAHHLNDWVESYLLNCFRGHPNHNPFELVTEFPQFTILHPFLLTKKLDFHQFLSRNGWMSYVVEDETNQVTKGSRRNWVRNDILPQLKLQKISLEKFAKRKVFKLLERVK